MQLQVLLDLPLNLVSALIGGALAILGNLLLEWYRGWAKRRRLRRNLAIEIQDIMIALSVLHNHNDKLANELERGAWESEIRHPYYDAHQENLMILSSHEIRSVGSFYNRVGSIHNEIYESDSPRVDVIKLSLAMAYTDYKNAYDSLTSPVSRLRQRIEQLFLSSDEPSITLEGEHILDDEMKSETE